MKESRIDIRNKNAAIFIMPRTSKAWLGAEALWITAAGWAAAAKRKFGTAWVVTQDRIAEPEEVIYYPLVSSSAATPRKAGVVGKFLPGFLKVFLKDLLLYRQSKKWNILQTKPWQHNQIAFVWQQHDLFATSGRKLADELGVPLIIYVHAPVVWETAKWGVKRYLWGWFLERFVEAPALKAADIVGCVSDEVADKLKTMGVDKNRIVVSPMAVDQHLFKDKPTGTALREKLGISNGKIVGWIGSFRSFHGLDLVVKAFNGVLLKIPDARLILVGDGQERSSIEKLVRDLNLEDKVIFAGRQPFAQIPSYVSLFDIALVSARSPDGFHYSPLKLREYLAAGKATIAPRAGEIPEVFQHGTHLLIYEAGDIKDLSEKMQFLLENDQMRRDLSGQGKTYVLQTGTWDYELIKILAKTAK